MDKRLSPVNMEINIIEICSIFYSLLVTLWDHLTEIKVLKGLGTYYLIKFNFIKIILVQIGNQNIKLKVNN